MDREKKKQKALTSPSSPDKPGVLVVPPGVSTFPPQESLPPPPQLNYPPQWADMDAGEIAAAVFIGLTALSFLGVIIPDSGPLLALAFVAACLGYPIARVVAHGRINQLNRQDVEDYERRWWAAKRQFMSESRRWTNTRPTALLEAAEDPSGTARALLRQAGGTVYLGLTPDSRLISAARRNQSVVIVATTQSGKTTGIVDPAIMAAPGAVVATSVKPDTLLATYRARLKIGRVWVLDPSGQLELPEGVEQAVWSPLWSARQWDAAKVTAVGMVGATSVADGAKNNPHWKEQAQQYLAPLLLAAALHQDCTIIDVHRWVTAREWVEPLRILTDVANNPSHPQHFGAKIAAAELASFTKDVGPDELSGIITTTRTVLDAYGFEAVAAHGAVPTFDPDAFVRSTDTLYVVGPERYQRAAAPIAAGCIEAIRWAISDYNDAEPFLASERPPVLFALDEMAQIAPLRDLPRWLGASGGQGGQFMVVFQTLAAAKRLWPDEWDGFLDLFAIKVAFGGITHAETAEALSKLSGDYDREYITYNSSLTTSTSHSWSESETTPRLLGTNTGSSTEGYSLGYSESVTNGTSRTTHKERRMTPADITASLPRGHAFVSAGNVWQILEVAGTYTPGWQRVVNEPLEDLLRPPPLPLVDTSLPELPPYQPSQPVPAPELETRAGQRLPLSPEPLPASWELWASRRLSAGRRPRGNGRTSHPRIPEATQVPRFPRGRRSADPNTRRGPLMKCPNCNDEGIPAGCPECDRQGA